MSWGTFGAASVTADSLDFAQFKDSMTVDADTSVNLYNSGATDLRFYNSNSSTEVLFLDGSTGRAGIGSTSPSYTLDVVGNIRAGTEFYKGTIGLGATGTSATTSGAYIVGAYAEFGNSTAPTVQGVLNDLDSVIGSLSSGTTGPWIDGGSYLYPSFGEYIGNPAGAGSNKITGLFVSDNSPVVYGTDNDFRTVFDGTNFIFGDTSNTFLSVTDSGTVGTFAFNTDDLYINSSGNVGIGTTNPDGAVLEVYDDAAGNIANFFGPAGNNYIYIGSSESTSNALGIGYEDTGDYGWLSVWGDAAGASLVLNNGGDVGIGITTPATKLDIDTGSNTDGLRLRGAAETTEILDLFVASDGSVVFSSVGGSDTSQYLDFRPEDDSYGLILRDSDGTGTSAYGNFYAVDATTDVLSINVTSVTDQDALNITSGNNVGIGTSNPGAKLDVVGTVDATDFTCTDCLEAGNIATGAVATAEILDGTILTGDISADTILAGDIATGAVATAEILDGTILTGDISADTILTGDIALDTILAADIAAGAVGTSEIADNTIAAADIAADAITASELATSAVGTAEILDGTILTGDISADTILAGDIAADAIGDSELFNGGVWNITSNLSIQGDNVGIGGTATTAGLRVFSSTGYGISSTSTLAGGVGVVGEATSSTGAGVYGTSAGNAVVGYSTGSYTTGFFQNAGTGIGLYGEAAANYGISAYRDQVTSIVGRFENLSTYCQVVPGGTGFTCPSDASLKKDVSTIDNALSKVMSLRGVNYRWKTDTEADPLELGFIAQEVEKVVPELVYTDPDNGIKSMGYGNLTPLLVNAVQEQQDMIDANSTQFFELSDLYTDLSFINSSLASKIDKISSAMAQIQNMPIEAFELPDLPIEIYDLQTEIELIKNNQSPIESKLSELSNSLLTLEEKVNGLMNNENEEPKEASESASFEDLADWKKEADSRLNSIETVIASLQSSLLEESGNKEQLADSDEKVTLVDLTVTGKTNLYDVGVIGEINAGLLVIDGIEGTINSLGTALKIQEEPTAPVEIMAGKVLIDRRGNLSVQEEITAKKYNVDTSDNEALSIGEASIQKGQKEILIKTKSVTDKSKIFLTPKTELTIPVSVIEQKDGEYFKVSIKDEADTDVVFNWWVVN